MQPMSYVFGCFCSEILVVPCQASKQQTTNGWQGLDRSNVSNTLTDQIGFMNQIGNHRTNRIFADHWLCWFLMYYNHCWSLKRSPNSVGYYWLLLLVSFPIAGYCWLVVNPIIQLLLTLYCWFVSLLLLSFPIAGYYCWLSYYPTCWSNEFTTDRFAPGTAAARNDAWSDAGLLSIGGTTRNRNTKEQLLLVVSWGTNQLQESLVCFQSSAIAGCFFFGSAWEPVFTSKAFGEAQLWLSKRRGVFDLRTWQTRTGFRLPFVKRSTLDSRSMYLSMVSNGMAKNGLKFWIAMVSNSL